MLIKLLPPVAVLVPPFPANPPAPPALAEFVGQVAMITGEYNIMSFLRSTESWMSSSGFRYRHDVKDRIHTYVILHEMGKKWSYFFEWWFKGAFKTLKAKDVEVNATDDTIVLKLSMD